MEKGFRKFNAWDATRPLFVMNKRCNGILRVGQIYSLPTIKKYFNLAVKHSNRAITSEGTVVLTMYLFSMIMIEIIKLL